MRIYDIESPQQIKKMNMTQLQELADDIRQFIIDTVSKTGGHLAGNLGIVETICALHYVFDIPTDKLIFDVGWQCYAHKILTGRSTRFATLRKQNGLTETPNISESHYDCWDTGHTSTALSSALGFAVSRHLKEENYHILCLINKDSLSNGMTMEALREIGMHQEKVIIICNDDSGQTNLSRGRRLNNANTSQIFKNVEKGVLKNPILSKVSNVKSKISDNLVDARFFQELHFNYIGPVDGHSLTALVKKLTLAKKQEGPIVIHVVTQKAKGFAPALASPNQNWDLVNPFDKVTGKSLLKLAESRMSWSEIIGRTISTLAANDQDIVAIRTTTESGDHFTSFKEKYPDRFFDCRNAYQHAVTMSCSMAVNGLHPFVHMYSTSLQKAYDSIISDLGRLNVPVVLGIDHAGLCGDVPPSDQGIYDISILRTVPNMVISQPKDATEAQNLLYTAFHSKKPFAIRYPNGTTDYEKNEQYAVIPIGTWAMYQTGLTPKQIVITYGPDVDRIIYKAKENKMDMIVVNARYIKPLDFDLLNQLKEMDLPIYIFETDCKIGSLSSAIAEYYQQRFSNSTVLGVGDHYIEQSPIRTLRIRERVSLNALFKEINDDGKDSIR